jgi:hypothetical protein
MRISSARTCTSLDAPSRGVGHAVEIAADADHAFVRSPPLEPQHRPVGRDGQGFQRRPLLGEGLVDDPCWWRTIDVRWIPTRDATPSTALVPQEKAGFPIPNPRLLLGFQGTKTARREGKSSPFSDAGGCTSCRNSGFRLTSLKLSFALQPRRSSPQSETDGWSDRDATSRLGLASCRSNIPPAGDLPSWAISKRGNTYLRTLLIHGSRCMLRFLNSPNTAIGRWALALKERVHANVAAVALANKQARTAWALLTQGTFYLAGPAD